MKALVTGAGGFLGGAIAAALAARGWEITTLQRGFYQHLETAGYRNIQATLTDLQAVVTACEGQDAVFHVAAKAGVWGSYQSYYDANVLGTLNVIAGCKRNNVAKLIYTSSPSVVFNGQDESGINEQAPYPESFLGHYSATKSIAEQAVLNAADKKLSCVALRPHLIWGPGDQHLLPRIIDRAQKGKLKFVGNGENLIDSTYIDNAVEAHLNAESSLAPDAACNGKAYFISNGDALPSKVLINKLLACAAEPPVDKHISSKVAYIAGAVLEATYTVLRIKSEPIMTRFVARQLATEHWFDLSAARQDLHYQSSVSNEEGFQRLQESRQA